MKFKTILLFVLLYVTRTALADPAIYYSNNTDGQIDVAALDGSQVTTIVSSLPFAAGIAVDETNSKLIYNRASEVYIANKDGTSATLLVDTGNNIVYGLDVNPAAQTVYYLLNNRVRRINYDGSGDIQLYNLSGFPSLSDLIVDTVNSRVYASDNNLGRIYRTDLDGGGLTNFVIAASVTGIAVDTVNSKLYYGRINGSIRVVNLDGTGDTAVFPTSSGISALLSLAVDSANNRLYYADPFNNIMGYLSTTGTGRTTLLTGKTVYDIHVATFTFPTPTPTATATATNTPTSTATNTPTNTPTSTPTMTPSSSPTIAPTIQATQTATVVPSATVPPTVTTSPTPALSPTSTSSPTVNPSPQPTLTNGSIVINVVDAKGQPVPGAVVKVAGVGSFVTDAEGNAIVKEFPADYDGTSPLLVSVARDGFNFTEIEVSPNTRTVVKAASGALSDFDDCTLADTSGRRRLVGDRLNQLYLNAIEVSEAGRSDAKASGYRKFVKQFRRYLTTIRKELIVLQKAESRVPAISMNCPQRSNCSSVKLRSLVKKQKFSAALFLKYSEHASQAITWPGHPENKRAKGSKYLGRARSLYQLFLRAQNKLPKSVEICRAP